MANAYNAARTITVWANQHLTPEANAKAVAQTARRIRDDYISAGRTRSKSYRTFVNNVEGAAEETIRPGGEIVYLFQSLGRVATEALMYLVQRSPVESGDFAKAWIVAVNGKVWAGDLNDIPGGSEVYILNPLPYTRKIETGHQETSGKRLLDPRAKRTLGNRFKGFDFQVIYTTPLPGSISIPPRFGRVPYVLQGHQRSSAKRHAARLLALKARTVATNRRDLRRGELLTYPTLVITEKSDVRIVKRP